MAILTGTVGPGGILKDGPDAGRHYLDVVGERAKINETMAASFELQQQLMSDATVSNPPATPGGATTTPATTGGTTTTPTATPATTGGTTTGTTTPATADTANPLAGLSTTAQIGLAVAALMFLS